MKRDEIRDKNWKQEVLDKGYFIFQGLLNQDDIPVIKERVRFIAKRDVPWIRAIRPKNQYLDYLPVCENGHPLDLPNEFLIDEDQVLAMAS